MKIFYAVLILAMVFGLLNIGWIGIPLCGVALFLGYRLTNFK